MKQRFFIQKSPEKKKLTIEEYAAINADPYRKGNSEIAHSDYTLLSLQTYELQSVKTAISKGKSALISELRTPHFFPVNYCIDQIATVVIDLCVSKGEQSAEFIADDRHFPPTWPNNAENAETTEKEQTTG
jgi:hypothetical protein